MIPMLLIKQCQELIKKIKAILYTFHGAKAILSHNILTANDNTDLLFL